MTRISAHRDINRYYDFIYFWSQITGRFRAFSETGAYAIHRPLRDESTDTYSDRVIHDLIAAAVAGIGEIDALDAGCGYGGTCLDLGRKLGGRWLGITTNARQVRIARRNARAMDLAKSVAFIRQSYDAPLPHTFSLILGIESLVHSFNPAATIANLAAHLRSGGHFIIVDDMLSEHLSPQQSADVAAFARLWRCPAMPTLAQWRQHLEAAGCCVETKQDLSHLMWPRTEAELDAEIAVAARRRLRDAIGLHLVRHAQLGGLLLEGLTLTGASRYVMLQARKR
jgi:SAM-dependent methyltransferase